MSEKQGKVYVFDHPLIQHKGFHDEEEGDQCQGVQGDGHRGGNAYGV